MTPDPNHPQSPAPLEPPPAGPMDVAPSAPMLEAGMGAAAPRRKSLVREYAEAFVVARYE